MKRDIRAIIRARRNPDERAYNRKAPSCSQHPRAHRIQSNVVSIPSLNLPLVSSRSYTVGHTCSALGPLRYVRQVLSRKPQGHFFPPSSPFLLFRERQVCSCVAWFRTDTCVITHKSTSRHSRAHVVGIHVCQPRTLARKRATHIVVQHTAQYGPCQSVRSASDVTNEHERKGEMEERGRGKAESDVRIGGWIIVRTLRSGIARPPRLNCDQGLNGDFQGR